MKKIMLFKLLIICLIMFVGKYCYAQNTVKHKPNKKTNKASKHYKYKDVGFINLLKTNPELRTKTINRSAHKSLPTHKSLVHKSLFMSLPINVHLYGDVNFNGTFDYAIELGQAKQDITRYIGDHNQNTNTFFFLFDAADLQNYIDGSNSTEMEIRIAENSSNQIYLTLVLQDGLGGHIYLTDGDNCYLFANVAQADMPGGLTTSLTVNDANVINDNFYGYIPYLTAAGNITSYHDYVSMRPTPQKMTTLLWTYNSDILSEYLDDAIDDDAEYIQFIFTKDQNNNFSFVIDAVDENLNHLYFNQNGANCVLDNCDPCPICQTLNFEDCTQ